MKKSYIQPELLIVKLHTNNLCQLIIGSTGDGTQLVKENPLPDMPSADFWKGDWGLDAME
ncbi:MAG: hypothetical protein J5545_12190 [Bacteroidaceae bacterium]|nr:hypothetical protein [Bacteroidaceae bacterium]